MSDLTPASAIPLLAALITGSLGLLGLVISKETKVSDFRQQWIDALREEVADLVATLHHVALLIAQSRAKSDAPVGNIPAVQDGLRQANKALFTIRLRLNPNEDASASLLSILQEVEEYSSESRHNYERVTEYERKIVTAAKVVLKQEWDRVRVGETAYTKAKSAAATIVGILLVAFLTVVALGMFGRARPSLRHQAESKISVRLEMPATATQQRLPTASIKKPLRATNPTSTPAN